MDAKQHLSITVHSHRMCGYPALRVSVHTMQFIAREELKHYRSWDCSKTIHDEEESQL